MNEQDLITRIRVQYTKGHPLRFTGHLDLQRLWERLLRRSGLPVRYSQGYHPRARLNLASALPLGFISDSELLDFWMNEPRPLDEVQQRLEAASPPGMDILSVEEVALSEDSLQSRMHASEFDVAFFDPIELEELNEKVRVILAKDEIIRKRRKKTYNLRPLILKLEAQLLHDSQPGLWMSLLAEPGVTGRPDEVLDEMGFENTQYLIRRIQLLLQKK
ncbi:MAG: TIGR03936 family radical SAM-associated protein [Brevefilum sp.]